MNSTPPTTPWASLGLWVLGLALVWAAIMTDTGSPNVLGRALTRLLTVLGGVSLASAVIVGVLS